LKEGKKKLVLEFTHDTHIMRMLRSLMGFERFHRLMQPHLIIDFLSSLRFRVRDHTIRMYFNDLEVPLHKCYKDGETVCNVNTFIRMIDQSVL